MTRLRQPNLFDLGPSDAELSAGGIVAVDCIEGMNAMRAGLVDLVFVDPPYNIGYGYDVYRDTKSVSDYLEWCRDWAWACHRILKPNGSLWVAIGDEFAAEMKVLLHRDVGFYLRSWVVWHYTFGVNCQRKFTRSHCHLFHFTKDAKDFVFNRDQILVPSARQMAGDKRAAPGGRIPDDTWQFSRVCGTFKERQGWHPCQMPEAVLARVLRTSSNEGDLVVDPMCGSGTTLAVAKKLGRRGAGFELSAEYARLGQLRVDLCRPGDPIQGDIAPGVTV